MKSTEVVENHILTVLSSYGFTVDDVKTSVHFVTDRGSNLKAMTIAERANCWAHLINNVVQEMCNEPDAKQIITDASKLVKHIKKSGLNRHFDFSLKSYCSTRWSTVYTMLNSIYENYETIHKILDQRSQNDRSQRDCLMYIECMPKSTIAEMIKLLKPFKDWTDIIEADKRITIHKVWPIYIKITEHLVCRGDDDEAVVSSKNFTMIEDMRAIGREYIRKKKSDFEPTMEQKIAVALHPRFKKLKKMTDAAREETYTNINSFIPHKEVPTQTFTKPNKTRTSLNSFEDFADSEDESNLNKESSEFCNELNEYLRMPSPNNPEFQSNDDSEALAEWWFRNKSIFPNLFKLFMRISAIPASSASSERCFSIAGLILCDRRSCLLPKNVSNLVMCRNHYQK